jgi:hypothetical protein
MAYTKAEITSTATYARKLLAELLKEQDPAEREEITNELVASVIFISEGLAERG